MPEAPQEESGPPGSQERGGITRAFPGVLGFAERLSVGLGPAGLTARGRRASVGAGSSAPPAVALP
jgi:hypothetical protein